MPNWQAPLDPHDKKPYDAEWSSVLDPSGDYITTINSVDLDSASLSAGLQVSTGSEAPSIEDTSTSSTATTVRVWLEGGSTADNSTVFDGNGITTNVEINIGTNQGLRLEQTWTVTARQR